MKSEVDKNESGALSKVAAALATKMELANLVLLIFKLYFCMVYKLWLKNVCQKKKLHFLVRREFKIIFFHQNNW